MLRLIVEVLLLPWAPCAARQLARLPRRLSDKRSLRG